MIHICEIYYKTFNTTQHLNQHKNKKNTCKPYTENKFNSCVTSENNVIDFEENEKKINVIDFEENSIIPDKNSSLPEKSSDNIKDYSVENLSVINLLEFVNTHKKILEEKNKLESTMIIIKKHIEDLTKENSSLKHKIHVVNGFINDYKKPDTDIFLGKPKKTPESI